MEYKVASIDDIDATLKLHAKYQIKEEDKKDGFVTTAFTKEELTQLIEQEQGLFIAKEGDEVLAYVMSASWQFGLGGRCLLILYAVILTYSTLNKEIKNIKRIYDE